MSLIAAIRPDDWNYVLLLHIGGAMIYLDAQGRQIGYEDVWTKIDMCRAHYAACGLSAGFFARQRDSNAARAAGASGRRLEIDSGARVSCAAIVSCGDDALNGASPASSS